MLFRSPAWLTVSNDARWHDGVFAFYCSAEQIGQYLPHYRGMENKVVARQTYLEVFGDENPTAVVFDYVHKDLLGNAEYKIVPLELLQALCQTDEK